MAPHPFTVFSKVNRRQILLLIVCHLLWSAAIFALELYGRTIVAPAPWISIVFIALQLFAASQLLLPALLLHPEERSRSFYLFWFMTLAGIIWLSHQLPVVGIGLALMTAVKSGLLLLVATLCGAALARYVQRLWELIPIALVMTLADFFSWLYGPTALFTKQIQLYYQHPVGPPPLVDMILIKFALPGVIGLSPLFGIADWIMVVFFAIVARRHGINDNLFGMAGELLAQQGRYGRYLPVSVVALMAGILLAQGTGLFIPALPLIALIMLLWYASHYLYGRTH